MKLDHLSKQCIIIGVFTMAVCVNCILIEVQILSLASGSFFDNSQIYVTNSCNSIAVYAAIIISAILKIVGIKKRLSILLVPYLIAGFFIGLIIICSEIQKLDPGKWINVNEALILCSICGLAAIVMYPLFRVFNDIRAEKLNKVESRNQYKDFVSKF